MQQVYLAGGMETDWRERVSQECDGLSFISPVEKEVNLDMNLHEYSAWDLHYVRQADIVFGYMERTNPSGIGLACEIGFARGLSKTVILVLEPENIHFSDSKLAFMRSVADITFEDLKRGVEYLGSFSG